MIGDRSVLSCACACLLALATAGCPTGKGSGATPAPRPPRVVVAGSSNVSRIAAALAVAFEHEKNATVSTRATSTADGFARLARGDCDVACARRPMAPAEAERCRSNQVDVIELPIACDAVAVVVPAGAHWVDHLTYSELRRLWETGPEAQMPPARIGLLRRPARLRDGAPQTPPERSGDASCLRWSDLRPDGPESEVHALGPRERSATCSRWSRALFGTDGRCRSSAEDDDECLAACIAADPLAVGVVSLPTIASRLPGELRVVPIDDEDARNGTGPIVPSPETIADGSYGALGSVAYIYVAKSATERAEVRDYVTMWLDRAPDLTAGAGFLPLPPNAYEVARARFAERRTCSAFGGTRTEPPATDARPTDAP